MLDCEKTRKAPSPSFPGSALLSVPRMWVGGLSGKNPLESMVEKHMHLHFFSCSRHSFQPVDSFLQTGPRFAQDGFVFDIMAEPRRPNLWLGWIAKQIIQIFNFPTNIFPPGEQAEGGRQKRKNVFNSPQLSIPPFHEFFTSLFTTTTPHGEVFLSLAIALGNSNGNHGNLLPSDRKHTVPRKMP